MALLFISTFYFLGDTGKHADDYTVALRNRVSGALIVSNHPWERWPYFWRPLHLAHVTLVNTISWNHPWLGHLELTLIHGIVSWMVCRFLRTLGVSGSIGWSASLLFLACPLIAEAVMWTSASCNAISAIFLLWVFELARRQGAEGVSPRRTIGIGVLSFLTACWYEPAAAALLAVGPVYMAAAASRASLRSAAVCTGSVCLGAGLYVALLVVSAPPNFRGGTRSLVTPALVANRTGAVLASVLDAMVGERGRDVLVGSVINGWQSVQTPIGLTVMMCVIALACASLLQFLRVPRNRIDGDATPRVRPRGWLLVIGVVVLGCSLIPIIAVNSQLVELRSLYIPMIGATLIGAALARGATNAMSKFPASGARTISGISIACVHAAACVGALGMIGFQTQFRTNSQNDLRITQQLRSLVPDPPSGTIFLPLQIDIHGAATGRPGFDRAIHGSFETTWSCRSIVQVVFGRADVTGGPVPLWLKNISSKGFCFLEQPRVVPWRRCVPFMVDARGEVQLVESISVHTSAGETINVNFPRVPHDTKAMFAPPVTLHEVGHGTGHAHCVIQVSAMDRDHTGH